MFKADYVQNCNTVVTDICISILVDCCATAHIITSKESFLSSFNEKLDTAKYIIELADGSRSDNVVLVKGNASISVHDNNDIDIYAIYIALAKILCSTTEQNT